MAINTYEPLGTSTAGSCSTHVRYAEVAPPAVSQILSEPDVFREFIIHMCGFTDNDAVPSKEAWDKLRERVKEVAAEYVLARRDMQAEIERADAEAQRQLELDLAMRQGTAGYPSTGTWLSTTTGYIGDTTTTTSAGQAGTLTIAPALTGSGIAGATILKA